RRWAWPCGCHSVTPPSTEFATTTLFSLDGDVLRNYDHGSLVLYADINANRVLTSGFATAGNPTVRTYTYAGSPRLSWRREDSGRNFEHRALLFSDNSVAISGSGPTDPALWLSDEQVIV